MSYLKVTVRPGLSNFVGSIHKVLADFHSIAVDKHTANLDSDLRERLKREILHKKDWQDNWFQEEQLRKALTERKLRPELNTVCHILEHGCDIGVWSKDLRGPIRVIRKYRNELKSVYVIRKNAEKPATDGFAAHSYCLDLKNLTNFFNSLIDFHTHPEVQSPRENVDYVKACKTYIESGCPNWSREVRTIIKEVPVEKIVEIERVVEVEKKVDSESQRGFTTEDHKSEGKSETTGQQLVELNPCQEDAVEKFSKWISSDSREPFVLAGYAGSGKTTVVNHFVSELFQSGQIKQAEDIKFLTPTNKAAQVLKAKLQENPRGGLSGCVSTIASLTHFYEFVGYDGEDSMVKPLAPLHPKADLTEFREFWIKAKEDGLRIFDNWSRNTKFRNIDGVSKEPDITPDDACHILHSRIVDRYKSRWSGVKFVIIDECSALTARDQKHFESISGIRLIFVGDPEQLPPVVDGPDDEPSDILSEPTAVLAKVMRQPEGGLLDAAMRIRNGQILNHGTSSDRRFTYLNSKEDRFNRSNLFDLIQSHDVILVARNQMRLLMNDLYRRIAGHMQSPVDFIPKPGERLIAISRYSNRRKSCPTILNGDYLEVESFQNRIITRKPEGEDDNFLPADFKVTLSHRQGQDGNKSSPFEAILPYQILSSDHVFGESTSTTHCTGPRTDENNQDITAPIVRSEWAYALTVHKAQGSQWPRVLVINDGQSTKGTTYKQWMYVACTRATQKLTLLDLDLYTAQQMMLDFDRSMLSA